MSDQHAAQPAPRPSRQPEPGDRPPRRLLDQAPGARLAPPPGGTADEAGSLPRAGAYGLIGAGIGIAAHVFGAVLLLLVAPLVVVAGAMGLLVGSLVRLGGGTGGGAPSATARRVLAAGISVGAVAVALLVAWALSGRYLDPLAFLDQVYGLTAPAQVAVAAAGALAGSR